MCRNVVLQYIWGLRDCPEISDNATKPVIKIEKSALCPSKELDGQKKKKKN